MEAGSFGSRVLDMPRPMGTSGRAFPHGRGTGSEAGGKRPVEQRLAWAALSALSVRTAKMCLIKMRGQKSWGDVKKGIY